MNVLRIFNKDKRIDKYVDIICGGSVQRAILSLTGDSRCEKKRKRVRYNGLYEEAKTETASNGSITFLLIHLIIICAYIL